jgi:hypothetical protein
MSESIHAPALGVSGAEPDGSEVDSRSGWWCAGGSSARLESRRGLLHSQPEGASGAWQSTLPCRGARRWVAPNAPELIRRVSGTSLCMASGASTMQTSDHYPVSGDHRRNPWSPPPPPAPARVADPPSHLLRGRAAPLGRVAAEAVPTRCTSPSRPSRSRGKDPAGS